MIRRIKAETQEEHISFIGFSQGATSMMFALQDAAVKVEIEHSLNIFIALAPCIYFRTEGKDQSYFETGLFDFP